MPIVFAVADEGGEGEIYTADFLDGWGQEGEGRGWDVDFDTVACSLRWGDHHRRGLPQAD